MSLGGLLPGAPIYVKRPAWFVYLISTIASVAGCYFALQLGPLCTIVCAVLSYVWYDFYSGLLHVMLDEPRNIPLPLLGQPALEFQWHHLIPSDIVRKDFIDVCGDLSVVVLILAVIHMSWSSSFMTEPVAGLLTVMKLGMAYFGQYSHRDSHDSSLVAGSAGKRLQNLGLMISPKAHKSHHQAPHDVDFCLIGLCNPIMDVLHRSFGHMQYRWITVFLMVSIIDIKVMSLGVRSLI